ncbi:MAG: MBL fold metallo-hydrolase [Candidatus Peregrinibacteria bacterium]
MIELSEKWWKRVVWVVLCGWILLGFLLWQVPDGRMHVWFLDVGQGDSILVKTPLGHQILVDGGPGNVVVERLGEVMPYFDGSIDMVVLTHPHADHVDGLVEVLSRYSVDSVLLTGVMDEYAGYIEFLKEIEDGGVDVYVAESGMDFRFGDVYVDVIYPVEQIVGEEFSNLNNSSIGVVVSYGDNEILLTGDLEEEEEVGLVVGDVDIFKAGHHGSKTANTLELLRRAKPEMVVIQCGAENKFGHPHVEALERFEEMGVEVVKRNDLDGTVEVVF